ncbi:MAG: hypothetical protein ACREMH_05390, partial [Gemmatimonadales bacterium]
NLRRRLEGRPPAVPPPTTMLGGLLRYLREADPRHFQPMNANFGLLEPLEGTGGTGGTGKTGKVRKAEKKERLVERAVKDLEAWWDSVSRET